MVFVQRGLYDSALSISLAFDQVKHGGTEKIFYAVHYRR
jgi:hypothetical protein